MSYRKPGQGGDAAAEARDLRAELLQAEAAHFAKKNGGSSAVVEDVQSSTNTSKRQLENGSVEDDEDPEAKRRRILEETRDIDADSDDAGESDSSDDDRFAEYLQPSGKKAHMMLVMTTKMRPRSFNGNLKRLSASVPRNENKRSD